MVQKLSDHFGKELVLDNETVEDIANNYVGKQTQEIDMSIYFLLLSGCHLALPLIRYRQPSPKFICGCFMILLPYARYFFDSMRRKTI